MTVTSPNTVRDPDRVDWPNLELPPAWPDELDLRFPHHWARFLAGLVGARRPVRVPEKLPGLERIPRYVLQEFHQLPNGFYSRRVARGYARQFDRTMLGATVRARARLVEFLGPVNAVLDLGCADGKLARAIRAAGATDVWALDASPYLLQVGATLDAHVQFVHGAAEDLPFADERFDAIGACFFFHELPPKSAALALRECARCLRPGGRIALCEPTPQQFEAGAKWRLWREYGWRGLYFRAMARRVFEPFVALWHRVDYPTWFADAGFELELDQRDFPCRLFVARRR